MRSSDRRIDVARKVEEVTEEDEGPISRDTIPAPPPSESHPGPLEQALDRGQDTIPTPPPESGITPSVVIPKHRDVDIDSDPGAL
jgi:hypothetical protein